MREGGFDEEEEEEQEEEEMRFDEVTGRDGWAKERSRPHFVT